MRIAIARMKTIDQMPSAEFCCDEVVEAMKESGALGSILKVDLDNTSPYLTDGHCGQKLPYQNSVMVIGEDGKTRGYVPFDLIDLDEGCIIQN